MIEINFIPEFQITKQDKPISNKDWEDRELEYLGYLH